MVFRAGGFAEGGELGVEELGGEGAGECFDGVALLGGEAGEFGLGSGQLGLAELLGVLLERLDGGNGIKGLESLVISVDFPTDDDFGCGGFAGAIGKVGGGDLLEVVNVVDEATFDLVHAGIDIAGNGDIDEEHGAVAAALEEVLAVGAAKDLLGCSGTGDDNVGAIRLLVEGVKQ